MKQRLNGCHNHAPYVDRVIVQNGYVISAHGYSGAPVKLPRYKWVSNPMTKDCQYTKDPKVNDDPACTGCNWKQYGSSVESDVAG